MLDSVTEETEEKEERCKVDDRGERRGAVGEVSGAHSSRPVALSACGAALCGWGPRAPLPLCQPLFPLSGSDTAFNSWMRLSPVAFTSCSFPPILYIIKVFFSFLFESENRRDYLYKELNKEIKGNSFGRGWYRRGHAGKKWSFILGRFHCVLSFALVNGVVGSGPGRVVRKTKESTRIPRASGKRALFMPVGTDLVKCLFKRDATW